MTADSRHQPSNPPQRWARLRAQDQGRFPAVYHGIWFRVLERHDPDVPANPGYIWLDLAGKMQRVRTLHFEVVERAKRRILVVEDDPSVRQTLHIALTKARYEVFQARDGAEAIRLWREEGPDLVITDLHMPDKNGLEVILELRAHSPSTPVIAISDGGRTKQIELLGDAKLLGAVRSVAKPFTLDEMLAAVQEELDASRE